MKPTIERRPNVKSTYSVQKTEARTRTLKPVRPRAKRHDTFDVPSSDDEITSPPRIVSPPKYVPKLYDDTDTSSAQLAPWERKRMGDSQNVKGSPKKRNRTPEVSPEAQLKRELARATFSPDSSPSSSKRAAVSPQSKVTTSPRSNADINGTSAAARLAARRRLGDGSAASSADELAKPARNLPKRSVIEEDGEESTPRKRVRTVTVERDIGEDVAMQDVVCEAGIRSGANQGHSYRAV